PSPSSAASASPFSALTSAIVTFAPPACSRRLVASPSPEAPPTTSAPAPSMFMAREPSERGRGANRSQLGVVMHHRDGIDRLIGRQGSRSHGIVTRAQLLGAGVSAEAIRVRLQRGSLLLV